MSTEYGDSLPYDTGEDDASRVERKIDELRRDFAVTRRMLELSREQRERAKAEAQAISERADRVLSEYADVLGEVAGLARSLNTRMGVKVPASTGEVSP